MNVRKASSKDGLLLSSLTTDVQRLHAEHHPDIFKMPQSDNFAVLFFDEMLNDPSVSIFIAEEDGQAMGCMLCKPIERAENPFTYAMQSLHISQISVLPTAQGRGVGAALITRAEQLARELGVSEIRLDSWDFNIAAHAFFEHMGFEKYNHRFWKNL